jgi:hypothetical protein
MQVRTNDDITIRVKLMLFYQLKDTETMVNTYVYVTCNQAVIL